MPIKPATADLNDQEQAALNEIINHLTSIFCALATSTRVSDTPDAGLAFERLAPRDPIPAGTPAVMAAVMRDRLPIDHNPIPHIIGKTARAVELFNVVSGITAAFAAARNVRPDVVQQIAQRAIERAAEEAGIPIHDPAPPTA